MRGSSSSVEPRWAASGAKANKAAYTTFADDIKIGSLEFKDCAVEVMDKGNVADSDGLIGMDVFSRFLVTLDYPMRKLLLAPLPRAAQRHERTQTQPRDPRQYE